MQKSDVGRQPAGGGRGVTLADIKVGYTCNNRCAHCVVEPTRRTLRARGRLDLTTDECIRLIREAAAAGIPEVTLTGGEATIRSDFLDLVSAAAGLGLRVQLQTNGRAFRDRDFASRIVGKIQTVTVALHAPMAEVHDRIAGVRGAFEQTVAGIRNLRAAGVEKVMVKVVVTRHNAALLEAMVVTLLSLTVRDVNFAYVHGCGCTPAEYDALAPRFTELWPQVQRAQASADRVGVDTRFEAFPLCRLPAPWRATEIPHLEGMDSVFTMVGEDTRKWNETRRAMKRKGRRCPTCGLDELCEGVWQEYFERFGDGDLVPQPPQARAEMLFAILCARKERPLC